MRPSILTRAPKADKPRVAGARKDYLTFRVARKDLAIDAKYVRAILPLSDLIPVAGARPEILGVVRIAGSVINVVDAAARLRLPVWSRGKQPRIIVLGTNAASAAFVADRVCNVVSYADRNLSGKFLRGEGRERMLIGFDQIVQESDLAEIWAVIP